jgi:hypothetical protein
MARALPARRDNDKAVAADSIAGTDPFIPRSSVKRQCAITPSNNGLGPTVFVSGDRQ